jgi:tripartite-type tricarboxylate transporter receptor subunit TctC
MPTEQLLDLGNTNYDAQRFNWIGRVTSAVEMAIVWHTVPLNSVEDIRQRETLMGGTGPTSATVFGPWLLDNLAGMRFKVVTGFNGTTEIALAMERGEVEGSATPLESLTSYRADWVRDHKIKILFQYTATRDPQMPDVPAMVELGTTQEARDILSFYASAADIGRSIVAPPGMAGATVTELRRAFDRMLLDADFLDEAKRSGIPIKPMSGERMQELVARLATFPRPLIAKARQARQRPQ